MPCNVGPRSMADYPALADSSIVRLDGDVSVFVGQRLDAFFVDVGSIFDLGTLRPVQNLHLIPTAAADGVNNLRGFNVHSLAIEMPIASLTSSGTKPTDVASRDAVLGVWTSAYRYRATVRSSPTRSLTKSQTGSFVQVSRLGNPLINEAIIPMSRKDEWNKTTPDQDKNFAQYGLQPELGKLLNVLYPGAFPNLAAYTADRADLAAILFTGIPAGVVPGFQNYTGATIADQLRLNVAIPPSETPNPAGIVGGDLAGFPNGRRVTDDVVTVELRAIAGATIPLVDPSFTPDAPASQITDGSSAMAPKTLATFPWLETPSQRLRHGATDRRRRDDHPRHHDAELDHIHADGSHHHHGGAAVSGGEARPIDGPVMLDIGGDVGAVIARLDDELRGHRTADPLARRPELGPQHPHWRLATTTRQHHRRRRRLPTAARRPLPDHRPRRTTDRVHRERRRSQRRSTSARARDSGRLRARRACLDSLAWERLTSAPRFSILSIEG